MNTERGIPNWLFNSLCLVCIIIVILASAYLYRGVSSGTLNTAESLDKSSLILDYNDYITEKNRVFTNRYNLYFKNSSKVYSQYYVDSAIYREFSDKTKSINSNCEKYMLVDDFDVFNIAPINKDLIDKSIKYDYVYSNDLFDDITTRYNTLVNCSIDSNYLYTFVFKKFDFSDDAFELRLTDDGFSVYENDKYRVEFKDLCLSGNYYLPSLNLDINSLYNTDSCNTIAGTSLPKVFGGVIVSLHIVSKPSHYDGIITDIGSVEIYDKQSGILLIKRDINNEKLLIAQKINDSYSFDFNNLRQYGVR